MTRRRTFALSALRRTAGGVAGSALLVFAVSALATYSGMRLLQAGGVVPEEIRTVEGPRLIRTRPTDVVELEATVPALPALPVAQAEPLYVPAATVGPLDPPPAPPLVVPLPALAALEPAPVLGPVEAVPASIADPEAQDSLRVVSGRVPRGGTVAGALAELGVDGPAIHAVSRAMRPVFDFRRARAGEFFSLIADAGGEVLSFEYQRSRDTVYRIERDHTGELVARADEVPLERRVVHLAGLIQSSVFEAVTELGERPDLVHSFADIFVWDIDFATQVRPGDEFRMTVEKLYDDAGFVRYGRILAAEYRTSHRSHTALYFEDDEGYGDYFTPEGTSVRRTFLRAPVNYSRISSRFSRSRLHPILKVRRPHEGIDYAAPTGTPVWAVADGTVIFRGWSGGFGRLVKIRHNNGYVSYYGHLSRYPGELQVGERVRQKQVIGYVGSSGLSTGPHLDYRVKVNGRYVDPLKLKFPNGQSIPVRARDRFEQAKEGLLAGLREAQPAVVLEAAL